MVGGLQRRQVPWCTIFLVVLAMISHSLVLVGNLSTVKALNDIGQSTNGWSNVGLGLSRSLQAELDAVMLNVTRQLTESITQTVHVQELLDVVVALAGNATDGATHANIVKEVALLQEAGPLVGIIPELVTTALKRVLERLMQAVIDRLQKLLVILKPALEQIGKWMIQFGDRIRPVVQGFSVTLDKVQKIFDQVMSQMAIGASNADEMLHHTFTLFDVSNTGFVTANDLKDVARLYSITALQSNKSDELLRVYDDDKDHRLSSAEFALLVHDSSLPQAMPLVLRAFAKQLSDVAGTLKSATLRSEVAEAVVDYLELMCAKNQTKVVWLSDALSNGSLPLEFSADVMVQLALAMDEPAKLTTAGIGRSIVGTMMDLHPDYMLSVVHLMSNSTFWVAEGFDEDDQPVVLERVTQWTMQTNQSEARDAAMKALSSFLQTPTHDAKFASPPPVVFVEKDVFEAMPSAARRTCEDNLARSSVKRTEERISRRGRLFSSSTSRDFLLELMGGLASNGEQSSPALATVSHGVPARPETLLFTKWLSWNATRTSHDLQEMSFKYSSESSSALGSIATQFEAMLKKMLGFLDMMERFATPSGIDMLERKVMNFAQQAGSDVLRVVETKVDNLMKKSVPAVEAAIDTALESAGLALGRSIANVIGRPLADALEEPMIKVLSPLVRNTAASSKIGSDLGDALGASVANVSEELIGRSIGDILKWIVAKAVNSSSGALTNSVRRLGNAEPLHVPAVGLLDDVSQLGKSGNNKSVEVDPFAAHLLSGAWEEIVNLLRSFENLLPQATSALMFARKEVSRLASNLDLLFQTFQDHGPPLFESIARTWKALWILYYCFLTPITVLLLVYAFWASGFFGGPRSKPTTKEVEGEIESWSDRMRACWVSCRHCMVDLHDKELCFWSCLILSETVVLLVFVVCLIFCVFGGIKSFIAVGCAEIYVLNDNAVCVQTLATLREFLAVFFVKDALEPLVSTCRANQLLTCELIGQKMRRSTILTVIFGFLAAVFSFQLLVESAVLHTKAVWRRRVAEDVEEET